MEFKLNASVFKNTPEDQKKLYGDKYDPNKNYPAFSGTLPIPKSQVLVLVELLQYAMRTELEYDEYLGEEFIPIKVSGWQKESKKGKKFLSLQYTPEYKTLMAAKEAKEAAEIPAGTVSLDGSATSLAQATGGSVVIKADQEDIF